MCLSTGINLQNNTESKDIFHRVNSYHELMLSYIMATKNIQTGRRFK